MTGLTIRTSAKVNLCLRVLGRRADGYHEIETVLHTVGLWDRLSLSPIPGEPRIALEADTPDVPSDEGNLCWRAADLIARHAKAPDGVAIRLEKSIPVAAGLGGGSSDAAATLVGLARLWELDLAPEEVASLAAQLGADVPFFLRGGCCLARGRGEELDPVPELSAWLVLVVPERRVPTAQAYAALRRGAARGRRRRHNHPRGKRLSCAAGCAVTRRESFHDNQTLDTPCGSTGRKGFPFSVVDGVEFTA